MIDNRECERPRAEQREIAERGPTLALSAHPHALPSAPGRYRPLLVLRPDQALVSRMTVGSDGRVETEIEIDGSGEPGIAQSIMALIWPGLRLARIEAKLRPVSTVFLSPTARMLAGRGPVPLSTGHALAPDRMSPPLPGSWPWRLSQALQVCADGEGAMLQVAIRVVKRDAGILRGLTDQRAQCAEDLHRSRGDARIGTRLAALDEMLEDSGLFAIEVAHSRGLDSLHRDLLALALFGTLASPVAKPTPSLAAATQLPDRLVPLRSDLPNCTATRSPAARTHLEVGRVASNCPVRLADDARMRHLYVLGATGTGKSTLLRRLIAQDIKRGEGVILIDPHGDLSREVRDRVPAHRQSDLCFADAEEGGLILPMLPESDDPAQIERAVDGLVSIFTEVLYENVKEAFGPIFEQYFRNAVVLLLAAPPLERQLSSLPRVFEDGAFRRSLLEQSADPACVSFWRNTALRTGGDFALANMTPYVTGKLTRLISTATARAVFSSTEPPLDLRRSMDGGRILIVRCAKGALGEGLSRLCVSATLLKLREAAMARSDPTQRRPVRLYLDEFQGARGGELAMLLAEGRKFGVGLTLANQSLSQIGGTSDHGLGSAILANAANLLLFRLGAPDAQRLGPWLDPGGQWTDLCRLPDFRMTARLLEQGVPRFYPDLILPRDPGERR